MEIIPEAFSPLYPRAFIIVINSLDSPDNMLTNNALYPWRASVGKDKQSLRIGISTKGMQSCSISHALAPCASLQITSGPASCQTSSALPLLGHRSIRGRGITMKSCTTSAVKNAICLANSFLSSTALLCSVTSDGSSCYWNQNGNRWSFKHQNSSL